MEGRVGGGPHGGSGSGGLGGNNNGKEALDIRDRTGRIIEAIRAVRPNSSHVYVTRDACTEQQAASAPAAVAASKFSVLRAIPHQSASATQLSAPGPHTGGLATPARAGVAGTGSGTGTVATAAVAAAAATPAPAVIYTNASRASAYIQHSRLSGLETRPPNQLR